MSPFAKIGFHASSIDGQEKGTGNALFGAYMNRLGLGYAAVGWATSASPQDISYLTPAKAKELGIDVTVLGDKEKQADTRPTTPPVGPPIRLTPQAPTISAVHTPPRTLGNLHLRVAPDPRAADALPPDQFIPKGTTLSISPRSCTVWMGSGRGAQDADNVWCPTTYGTTSGWVNAYYIAADKWEPVACELYPSARGCESE